MKTIFKYLAAALLLSATLASCEQIDYPDRFQPADGVPTIHYVRYTTSEAFITQAFMGDVVCIVGDNLKSVHELYFNDQPAALNSGYITDHTLIVSVPAALAKETTDKIYFKTNSGETVDYGFKVIPPAPSTTGMSLEYAKPGETVTIYGNYFIEPITVEFAGGVVATPVNVTMTSMDVVIPQGAQKGALKITTESGSALSKYQYLDDRGLMFDFDGKTGLGNHGWHNMVITTGDDALDGNYLQLGNGETVLSNWDDGNYSFEYWCGSWDTPQNITSGDGIALYNLVDFTSFSSMALKFEMCIPAEHPWKDFGMHLCFEGVDKVTISGNEIEGFSSVAGANAYAFNNEQNDLGGWARAIYQPWKATGSFDTGGKWITVTVPIADFVYDKDGNSAAKNLSSYTDFASLTIFVNGASITGTETAPIIKIDNIRAVPYK